MFPLTALSLKQWCWPARRCPPPHCGHRAGLEALVASCACMLSAGNMIMMMNGDNGEDDGDDLGGDGSNGADDSDEGCFG